MPTRSITSTDCQKAEAPADALRKLEQQKHHDPSLTLYSLFPSEIAMIDMKCVGCGFQICFRPPLSQENHGDFLFAVCDSHSQEMHDLHALLYEPDGYEFREPLASQFESFQSDLLILDYVVLDPKWRGHGKRPG